MWVFFFSVLWYQVKVEGAHLTLDWMCSMNPDPLERTTFWAVFVGSIADIACSQAVNPTSVQRFLSVPTLRAAQWYVTAADCS